MSQAQHNAPVENLVVRTYQHDDRHAVARLYTEGLLAGQISSNDTGADIDNIGEAYFSEVTSHFWVAVVHGQVLGMIGVMRDAEHTAEIRRLRVDKAFQHTEIASRLIEAALYHCKVHQFLKVVLDTRFERESAVHLFDRYGFQHTRTKNVHGKDMLEFYLDLYRQVKPER